MAGRYKPGGTHVILRPDAAQLARDLAAMESRSINNVVCHALKVYANLRGLVESQ